MKPLHIGLILVGVGGLIYQFKTGIYSIGKKPSQKMPHKKSLPPTHVQNPTETMEVESHASTLQPVWQFQPKNIPVLEVPKLPKEESVLPQTREKKDALIREWVEDGGIQDPKDADYFLQVLKNKMTDDDRESVYQYVQFDVLTGKKLPFGTKLYSQIQKIHRKYKIVYK